MQFKGRPKLQFYQWENFWWYKKKYLYSNHKKKKQCEIILI